MALPKSSETATRILQAAYRRLATDGYARLNMRDVAAEAEVNHALIHYYFGSKDQLVIAVLDEANRQLLERQKQMYQTPGDFAEKWAQARAFYEQDLASGFVRVQMELWAASLSNAALRENFLPRFLAWHRVLEDAVRDALAHYQLDLPVSPEAIATWIVDFWFGMEFEMLLGIPDTQAHHQEALDAMQRLLEHFDRQASSHSALSITER
ncbi:MAG: TetR/AcrR family transcriptional regulator [Ktedonobacteraceae bacterium]